MLNRLLFLLIFIPSFLLGQSSVSSSFAELFVDQSILLFDSGKADLPMEADSLLQPCLDALSKDPTLRVRVRAHTDNIGSVAYNKQLSERRANAVLARLFALGVDSSQVIAQGFGEEEPEATNQTEDGRQTNRRATVEVFQPVRMLPLRGAIIDAETKKPLIGQILIRGRYFRDSLQTDTLGIYETFVPENSNLVIETFSEGYFFETAMLQMKTEPIELPQIALPKIKPGVSFDLKNFYFVGNQAVLLERSEPELNRLLKFMQFNPTTLIEIAGHVNVPNNPPVIEGSWEHNLSIERAKMVHDFLVGQGISRHRMLFRGYGNWEMRFPQARSAKEQELNRRVEIRIMEEKTFNDKKNE